jgi:16S rRNA processing protein RimM
MAARDAQPRVCVGKIGAAHGLRGEVRLKSFTADPMAITRYGALESEDGALALEIEAARPGKDMLVARFKGVTDRTAAERLRNLDLYVPRARLPATEAEEFYHADLVGLAAVTCDGAEIGRVIAVHNFGAGDVLEIRPHGGATLMLPFTQDIVPEVDVAAGRLVVVPPAESAEPPPSPAFPHKGGGSASGQASS